MYVSSSSASTSSSILNEHYQLTILVVVVLVAFIVLQLATLAINKERGKKKDEGLVDNVCIGTYSRFISEGSGSICSLGSHPSDLLRAEMYTLCMCRLSFVLDPVRFLFSFLFFFLFFFFLFFLFFSFLSSSVLSSPKLAAS